MIARFKAFFIHLMLSSLVALFVLFLVFVIWYPAPLHQALAVSYVFLLLVVVDMVLGPLLTLIVYKSGKETLFLTWQLLQSYSYLRWFMV